MLSTLSKYLFLICGKAHYRATVPKYSPENIWLEKHRRNTGYVCICDNNRWQRTNSCWYTQPTHAVHAYTHARAYFVMWLQGRWWKVKELINHWAFISQKRWYPSTASHMRLNNFRVCLYLFCKLGCKSISKALAILKSYKSNFPNLSPFMANQYANDITNCWNYTIITWTWQVTW